MGLIRAPCARQVEKTDGQHEDVDFQNTQGLGYAWLCNRGDCRLCDNRNDNRVEATKRSINLAGKQRMLTQYMARSVCFAAAGAMPDEQADHAQEAQQRFERVLIGLRNGDSELGLVAQADASVLAELDSVDALWPGYKAALQRAWQDPVALQDVAQATVPILKVADRVVTAIAQVNADGAMQADLAMLINLSGQQRMLSQRASKKYCLLESGVLPSEMAQSLGSIIATFNTNLDGLIHGDEKAGLIPAPDEIVLEHLELQKIAWAPLHDLFVKATAGPA